MNAAHAARVARELEAHATTIEQWLAADAVDVRVAVIQLQRLLGEVVRERDGTFPFSWSDFEDRFRGNVEQILAHYSDLADRLVGCAPVLDVGFGRAELLELLRDRGVDAYGVEPDAEHVANAQARGLRAIVADGGAHLASLPDASLGAVVALQVVEHLRPQDRRTFVEQCARVVRPGGLVICDTPHPACLYNLTQGFFVDPTHLVPVHPATLREWFGETGFAEVEIQLRSPRAQVEEDAAASLLAFAAQEYAIVARR